MGGVMSNMAVTQYRGFCEAGEFDKAASLLELEGAIDPTEGWGDRRLTSLHWACRHGCLHFAKLMIEKYKTDPNVSLFGDHRETPLHIAAVEGNLDIVKYLTDQAKCIADVKRGAFRRTPIIYACGFADFPPHYSKDKDAIEVVRYLYNRCNCNPDYRDGFGMTALHNACTNRRFAIVRFLLSECNCNVALCDSHGDTPLHMVCRSFPLPVRDVSSTSEAVEIIRYLVVQQKCSLNAVNSYGEKPIDVANEPEVIAELVTFSPQGRKAGLYKNPDSFLGRSKPC